MATSASLSPSPIPLSIVVDDHRCCLSRQVAHWQQVFVRLFDLETLKKKSPMIEAFLRWIGHSDHRRTSSQDADIVEQSLLNQTMFLSPR